MGNGLCPISSLKATRQASNEYLSHKLPMKLPYSGCSLLFVPGSPSPAHSPLSSLSSLSSVNAAVAPVPRLLPLPLVSPSQGPCLYYNPWAHPDLSSSALWVCRTKVITRSHFLPKHSQIPVPGIHFTINQALLETITPLNPTGVFILQP